MAHPPPPSNRRKDQIQEDLYDKHIMRQSADLSMSTSLNSKSLKELSNKDYLLVKRAQSRDKEQFYDLNGAAVYRNYKYEKLNLQRSEFMFLSQKPLDFVGKSFAAQGTLKQGSSKAEQAGAALKRTKDILSLADTPIGQGSHSRLNDMSSMSSSSSYSANKSMDLMKSIQKKLASDVIANQFKQYPFENKAISKNLKHLDQSIKLRMANASVSMQLAAIPKWISPLSQHESMNAHGQNGSDLILKNELLIGMKSALPNIKSQEAVSAAQYAPRASVGQVTQSSDDDGSTYISVVHFNKAFKGHGKKLRCLLSNGEREARPTCTTGQVVVKHVQKKSQYLRVVQEFNRILADDKVLKAIARTKRIQTKMEVAISESEGQGGTGTNSAASNTISREIFFKETPYFADAVRQDGSIKERILSTISSEAAAGINFEGYLQFYQVFLLQNTPRTVLIDFLAKYFCSLGGHARRRRTVKLLDFIDTLEELMKGQNRKDAQASVNSGGDAWRQAINVARLENGEKDEVDEQIIVKEENIKALLERNILNPDILHKQLFI